MDSEPVTARPERAFSSHQLKHTSKHMSFRAVDTMPLRLYSSFFPLQYLEDLQGTQKVGASPYFSNDFRFRIQDLCPHDPLKSDCSKQRAHAHPA